MPKYTLFFFLFHLTDALSQPDCYFLIDGYYENDPIKVTTYSYSIHEQSTINRGEIIELNGIQVDNFNEFGKCSSHQWLSMSDEVIREFKFKYDKCGNLTEHLCLDEDRRQTAKYISIFDSIGNVTSTESYDAQNQIISRSFFEILYENSKSITIEKNFKGEIKNKHVNFYDDLGRKIKCLNYGLFSIPQTEYLYSYNSNNQLVESVVIANSHDTTKTYYAYDSKGREIEVSIIESSQNRILYSFLTVYIDSLNQLEYHEYEEGDLKSSTFLTLDTNGCIIKRIERNFSYPSLFNDLECAKIDETEIWYSHDDSLNWIEKTLFYNGKKSSVQKRVFEYR